MSDLKKKLGTHEKLGDEKQKPIDGDGFMNQPIQWKVDCYVDFL